MSIQFSDIFENPSLQPYWISDQSKFIITCYKEKNGYDHDLHWVPKE